MTRYLPQKIDRTAENVTNADVEAAYMPDLGIDAYDLPLDKFNVAHPALFKHDCHWRYFERLRNEAPVHFCEDSHVGPYWSVTKFQDILYVDTHHEIFSSDVKYGGIIIGGDPIDETDFQFPMFIQMDPPKHDEERKAVMPVVSSSNLANLESIIRERACKILDNLPINEEFDWVENVSIELTGQMLATLFDVPQEDRLKLIRWSDVAGNLGNSEIVETPEAGIQELYECLEYFTSVWNERIKQEPKLDFISAMAHAPETRDMEPAEYLGNLMLLIVGGNDTTRNSISGGIVALNRFPAEYDKLRANPALIESMVPEIIRWQTPLSHMRRTATQDTELGGKQIKALDQVVMWYVSGNRDSDEIDQPDEFIIDRARPRHHLSFGYGIHRCLGNRLAEMQLTIIWEEIMKRYNNVELAGDPVYVNSCFVKGYKELPVRIRA